MSASASKNGPGAENDTFGSGAVELTDYHENPPAARDQSESSATTPEPTATAATAAGEPDPGRYPSTLSVSLLTIGLCLAAFTTALDNTIIATAIPKITSEFNSLGDVGWYGSAYLLTTTALQPTFGKIYTYFNVKWTYLAALIIFEAGSVICAASPSSVGFIVGRAVAGIGGAALFSGGLNIVALVAPMHRRAMYNSILTSMFSIASVVGPLMGGAFVDRLTWRWCFWINLPFGAAALVAVAFLFHMPERPHTNLTVWQKIAKLDLLGASLFIPGIICLLLALQFGGIVYPWSDSRVWGCLLGFVLIIACFAGTQIYEGSEATIPPRLMRQRTVLSSSLFTAFLSSGIYDHFYYLPFYFQVVKGTTAVQSGISTIPYIVSTTVFAVIAGTSITFAGYYTPFTWAGSAVFMAGAGLLYTLAVDTPSPNWIGYQVLTGVGAGTALQVPFIAVQCAVDERDVPVANAIVGFFNSLGAGVSISAAQNIFSNTVQQQLAAVPGANVTAIMSAGATGIRAVTPSAILPSVLQAFNVAITTAFIYSIVTGGLAFVSSLFIELKSVKGRKLEMTGAA